MKRSFLLLLTAAALLTLGAPAVHAAGPDESVMPGESVDCRAVFAAFGESGYVIRSFFSEGVELESVTALRCDGEAVNASYYTTLARSAAGRRSFEIHLAPDWNFAGRRRLEVEYTVRLNEKAAVNGSENRCAVLLVASDGTPVSEAETFLRTGSFSCYRAVAIPEAGRQANPLSGACFCLYRDREHTVRVAFSAQSGGVYTACAAESCTHTRHIYLLKTPENGTLCLRGLGEGTYYLREQRPPQGYAVTADSLEIVLDGEGRVTAGGVETPDGVVRLIEQGRAAPKTVRERDPLSFYEKGCRVLSAVLGTLVMARRRLFR